MADNRASKDKRQKRNRAQRDARAARSAHAGEATSISKGASEPAAETKSARVSDAPSPGTDRKATTQDRRAAAKERMQARYPIPGQRAMFLGLVFTVVFIATTVTGSFPVRETIQTDDERVQSIDAEDFLDGTTILIAQEALGDEAPPVDIDILENEKLFDARSTPAAIAILAFPTIVCGLAYWFTKKPQRNTVWTVCLFILTGYFMVAQPFSLYAIPTLIAVGVGAFQSRKAVNAPRIEELKAQREAQRQAREAEKAAKKSAADDA